MTTATHVHEPVGGSFWSRGTRVLVALAALGAVALAWRFAFGLRSVANVHDGYPWGIWIALDVVVGTALGCGGYAVALLVYVLNRGRYHPLVRPAVLTSLLGYTLGAFAVIVDLGRWWELWKVPIYFWRWSGSPQLEVALCIMAYVFVLMIEASPALLEKIERGGSPGRRERAAAWLRRLDRAFPFLLALGVLGTGLAYIWNINVLRAWGPTNVSTVTYVTPVVGVGLGISHLRMAHRTAADHDLIFSSGTTGSSIVIGSRVRRDGRIWRTHAPWGASDTGVPWSNHEQARARAPGNSSRSRGAGSIPRSSSRTSRRKTSSRFSRSRATSSPTRSRF